MNFGMTILTQSMETGQNYAIQILIVLLLTLKLKIFLKIFPMMLKDKNKKVVAFRPKQYAYLMDDGRDHKKAKGTKKCVIKQKLV